jgi:hypothetical protein
MQALLTTLQNVVINLNQLVTLVSTIRATTSQFLSNAAGAFLTPTSYWNSLTEVTLTDAATVHINMATGINFSLLATSGIGATRALANPTNPKVGQQGYFKYTQSSTGSNNLTFGSQYIAAGGIASITVSSGNNDIDVLNYEVLAGPLILLTIQANVSH